MANNKQFHQEQVQDPDKFKNYSLNNDFLAKVDYDEIVNYFFSNRDLLSSDDSDFEQELHHDKPTPMSKNKVEKGQDNLFVDSSIFEAWGLEEFQDFCEGFLRYQPEEKNLSEIRKTTKNYTGHASGLIKLPMLSFGSEWHIDQNNNKGQKIFENSAQLGIQEEFFAPTNQIEDSSQYWPTNSVQDSQTQSGSINLTNGSITTSPRKSPDFSGFIEYNWKKKPRKYSPRKGLPNTKVKPPKVQQIYECCHCGKQWRTQQAYKLHYERNLGAADANYPLLYLECHLCQKHFRWQCTLDAHLTGHPCVLFP